MEEKKVREAIIYLKVGIEINKETIASMSERFPTKSLEKEILNKETAIEALEKQLPKKPIIKSEKEVPHTHNLGRLLRFHCPNCGKFIVAIYESDTERGGGISNSLKGCSTCLQAIDFSDYYSKRNVDSDKLNEELQWDD